MAGEASALALSWKRMSMIARDGMETGEESQRLANGAVVDVSLRRHDVRMSAGREELFRLLPVV